LLVIGGGLLALGILWACDGQEGPTRVAPDAGPLATDCTRKPGTLDPTFGDGGIATAEWGHTAAMRLVYQPDGKLVAAGDVLYPGDSGVPLRRFVLVRLNPNGTPDPTFGTEGVAETAVGNTSSIGALTLAPDGKILVAGSSSASPFGDWDHDVVARYLPRGQLDPTFGEGGITLTEHGLYVASIAVAPDGSVLVSGIRSGTSSSRTDFGVTRYSANGQRDTRFGVGGEATFDVNATSESGGVMAVRPTGEMLVAGASSARDAGAAEPSIVRADATGTLDITFGSAGRVQTKLDTLKDHRVSAIAEDPTGRILLAGSARELDAGSRRGLAVLRYSPRGEVDVGFGTGGRFTTELEGQYDDAIGVIAEADGRVLLGGVHDNAFVLMRLRSDGSLDPTFGLGGVAQASTDEAIPSAIGDVATFGCTVTLVATGVTKIDRATYVGFVLARYVK
jgi:uncharacterized delta-60 repeat protein